MTTSIRITIPVEPGAKTCEGCRWLWRFKLPGKTPDYEFRCNLFQSGCSRGVRLPECLASEREKVGERWILRYRRPQWVPTDAWSSREFDTREALDDERSMIERVNPETQFRIVHITRYRRRA